MISSKDTTSDLLSFIQVSPTPLHCVEEVSRRLSVAGFKQLEENQAWSLAPGDECFVVRDGSLVAFRIGQSSVIDAGFRILGAHTDSPNLKLKPNVHRQSCGYVQWGVEVYGGALTYTWLDRDLTIAGCVMVRNTDQPTNPTLHMVNLKKPLLRIPSLAIHLNRDMVREGLKLNAQKHLVPVFGLADDIDSGTLTEEKTGDSLQRFIGDHLDIDPNLIVYWDLSLADVTPPCLGGNEQVFIFSPRLDNQAMCHACVLALLEAKTQPTNATQLICLYDHEEVGSQSATGAGGAFAEYVMRRIAEVEGPGAKHGGLTRASSVSYQISLDMAHAVHPNYVDRHDTEHQPRLNGGPVLKVNAQQRYATDARGASIFKSLCQDADVPCQSFVTRSDLPCGSTIGPISAAKFGISTVDAGNPMLSMHSIREQAGAQDPYMMTEVVKRFLAVV
jgi:aspartyl aminopeptidase